ncbi:hypothetical protein pipiens_000850, partial [Culex pipiens pipiens]
SKEREISFPRVRKSNNNHFHRETRACQRNRN